MISFSANVKRELCRTAPGAKCCALAEMLGALLYANHFSASCIRIVTENPGIAPLCHHQRNQSGSSTNI